MDVILSKLFLDIKLAENYERELTYIGEILIIFNYHLSERNKQCLVELFKTQNTLIGSSSIFFLNAKNLQIFFIRIPKNLGQFDNIIWKNVHKRA